MDDSLQLLYKFVADVGVDASEYQQKGGRDRGSNDGADAGEGGELAGDCRRGGRDDDGGNYDNTTGRWLTDAARMMMEGKIPAAHSYGIESHAKCQMKGPRK